MNYKRIKQAHFFYCKSIVFCILALAYLVSGCSEDLYLDEESKSHLSHVKFENLLRVPKFTKALKEVEKIRTSKIRANTTNKTVMEEQYGFTISTLPVNVVSNDTLTSYTIFVTRDSMPTNVIENLVIQIDNSTNNIEAYLMKYVNDTEITENFNMIDFHGTKSILPITYNANESSTSSKISAIEICRPITSWYCYGSGHHTSSEGCTMGYAIVSVTCSTYFTDSGGGGGSGDTSTPVSSGTSGAIVTAPSGGNNSNSGGSSTPALPNPCSRLQKGTSSNAYKQKFKALNKLSNFTLPYETGFTQKMVNGALSYINLQAPNGSSLNFPSGSLNFTHVHNNHMVVDENGNDEYDGGVKILSPADVGALITTCQTAAENAAINPTEAFGVMISNEGIFAITLLEPLSLAEIGQFNSNLAAFENEYELKAGFIVKNPNLDAAGRKNALQKMLLSLLKDLGLENKVGLFEGEAQDNFDSYDINWTKKALNPANPSAAPVETPC
ncbi:MAG: hypothetical protein RLY43_1617 [Bacteroidota bacterium]|jgi:hypothetical protein